MRAFLNAFLALTVFLTSVAHAAPSVVHPYVRANNVYAGQVSLLSSTQLGATLGDRRLAGYVKISTPDAADRVTVSLYAKDPAGGPDQLLMSEKIATYLLDFIIPEIRAAFGIGGIVVGAAGAAFAGWFAVIVAAYGTMNGAILALTGIGTVAGAGAGVAITGSMLGMMGTFERGRIEEELKKVVRAQEDVKVGAAYIGLRSRDEVRDYHRHVSDLAHDLNTSGDARRAVRARFKQEFN